MSITGGSGRLSRVHFRKMSARVSTRAHVGRLRLSVVNVWDAFCVLFRTFVFEKVQIVFCSIHEMCTL